MKKFDKVWIVVWALFWLSLVVTFFADTLGIFETSNLGFMETIWISWIMLTVGFGVALAILTRVIVKD
jgi:hypothetical protein